ncbi:1123_t:CDS:2 [Scutellospora calospora]|uniref:1123_t:CDS:1 n=1 Tax=Scutellospora calospora TaxID=85575 RepID=A0ACA9JTQ4_9GLOM|nr:1123_t:CDS:2 [Scutellospora calospora]
MSCSEFTYLDFEECNVFEENSEEETFEISQIALANAQALLNNNDENDDIDWNETIM